MPDPLRIAQLAPPSLSVPPKRYGRTELVVWLLTEELVRRGHEVTLFASGDSSTSARLVRTTDRALWTNGRGQDPILTWAKAIDQVYAEADRFDVIHNHLGPLLFPTARRVPELPALSTLHGRLDLPGFAEYFSHFRGMPLVSISNAQRRPIAEGNWLATVYHGVDTEAMAYHSTHQGYAVFLGRIAPEKGLDSAIRAARAAGLPIKVGARAPLDQPNNPEAQRDWRYFEESVKPLLGLPGVEFVGEIGPAQKADFLGNAAVLLFPIRWPEPFGLVMIEALSCGTPVVAIGRGSAPEVIEHGVTGFVVDDEDGLVPALERIHEIDRARCRQVACERFSVATMASAYQDAYRRLLGVREPEEVSAQAPIPLPARLREDALPRSASSVLPARTSSPLSPAPPEGR